MSDLTAERLRVLLTYNPKTGDFTWKRREDVSASWNTRFAGKTAGGLRAKKDYWIVRVDDVLYLAHRLAWLYVTGEWPCGVVDHVDVNGLNNAWGNLREATPTQNAGNVRRKSTNKTGLKGVLPYKNGRYTAQIRLNGRNTHLGCFDTAEAAHAAYCAAARKCFGQYARAA